MGLQLLEREKRVLADVENPEPQFKGYEYLLEKYLKPRPRTDIVRALAEEKIRPTSMIDLSDGLASDLMQICKSSACGARIYLERIPIARQTSALAEEMHSDPVVAALNGGEDYELLFTVPLSMQEQIMRLGLVDVIGHITPASTGCYLVTPDGQDIKPEGTRVPGRISVLPPPAADGYSERERQMAVGPLRTGVTQRDAQPVPAFAANARHHAKCRTVAGRSIGDSPFGRSEDIRPTDPCSREQRHFRRQMQVVIRNGHQAEHHKGSCEQTPAASRE